MKHLKNFKLFEYKTGPKIKTRWTLNDAIITLYYEKFGFKKLGVDDEEIFINKYVGSTFDSFKMQCLNIKYLLSDEGLSNASTAQKNAIKKYGEYSENELKDVIENILDEMSEEYIAKNVEKVESNIQWKEDETERKLKQAKEEEDLKNIKQKYGNVKSVKNIDTNDSPYEIGDSVNHFKFGEGVVRKTGKIMEIEFDIGLKKVLYKPEFFI